MKHLKKIKSDLNDCIWAYSQIDAKFRLPEPYREQSIDFAKKAEFGVSSFHDTLSLGYESMATEIRMKQIAKSKGEIDGLIEAN